MQKKNDTTQEDITTIVDKITASFYEEKNTPTTDRTQKTNEYVGREDDEITRSEDGTPPPSHMQSYLDFSEEHHGSNQILVGVALFFLLISGVWLFLWYQSIQTVSFAQSTEYTLFNDNVNDFSELFDSIEEQTALASEQLEEAELKSNLATILEQKNTNPAVLGTSTTNTATTTTSTN